MSIKDKVKKIKKKGGISYLCREMIPLKLNQCLDPFIGRVMKKIYLKKNTEDIIIIESHNDFDNHGGAFYDYLIREGYHKKYKIVWFLRNRCPKNLPENVVGVRYNRVSFMRWYYYCLAKYIICGHLMLETIRPEQISVYTTHGSFSLKRAKNFLTLPKNITNYINSSHKTGAIKADIFGIEYPNDKELIIGFPGHDVFYNTERGDLHKITNEEYSKVILWMPTFRQTAQGRSDSARIYELGIPVVSSVKELEKLNRYLCENRCLLIIKIHPMQDLSAVKIKELSNIVILDAVSIKRLDIDNYRLMKDMDAMISDYSSAASDFLNLDRPIAYTTDDIDDYSIGFVVDDPRELMGGHQIDNFSDLLDFVSDVINENDVYREKRKKIINYIFEFHDGKNCQRLAEYLKL